MATISINYPSPVNIDALIETLRNHYNEVGQGLNGFKVFNVDPSELSNINSIVLAHDHNILTGNQLIAQARDVALQASNILQIGLSQDYTTLQIYNQLATLRGESSLFNQMVVKQAEFMAFANGWLTSFLDGVTPQDKGRIVLTVQTLVNTFQNKLD